jgi:hypothetical protein
MEASPEFIERLTNLEPELVEGEGAFSDSDFIDEDDEPID